MLSYYIVLEIYYSELYYNMWYFNILYCIKAFTNIAKLYYTIIHCIAFNSCVWYRIVVQCVGAVCPTAHRSRFPAMGAGIYFRARRGLRSTLQIQTLARPKKHAFLQMLPGQA